MLGASETLRFEKRALACLGHVRDATHVHPTSMSTARLRRLRRLASVRLLAVSVARLLAPHGRTPLRSPEAAPGRVRLRLRAVAPGLRTALRGRLPPTQPGMVDPGVSESECLNVDPCMHVRVLQLCVCVWRGGVFNPRVCKSILCDCNPVHASAHCAFVFMHRLRSGFETFVSESWACVIMGTGHSACSYVLPMTYTLAPSLALSQGEGIPKDASDPRHPFRVGTSLSNAGQAWPLRI